MWFQLFPLDINNFYTMILFQVIPSNIKSIIQWYGFKYFYIVLIIYTQLFGYKYL